jgi:F0F1-type ATP synthase assembly protein I
MRDRHVLIDRGAVEAMQSTLDRDATAIGACYALIGAIMLLGGVGFLADRYFATPPWCLLIGLIAGLVTGFYQLARVVRR